MLGAIIGSFAATLVIRWPEGRSVMRGRSQCDGCGHRVAAVDLVPLVSAALLRGRCRHCAARIDPRHWQIELACLAVGASAGWVAPGIEGIAGAVFGWLLVTLAALDIAAWWLPDRLTGALALTGIAAGAISVAPAMSDRLIGGVAGFGSLFVISALYKKVRGRVGLGGGDPKLFGAIGLWLGWRMLPFVLVLACLLGLASVALVRLRGQQVRRDDRLPFGALLGVAAYPLWLLMIGASL